MINYRLFSDEPHFPDPLNTDIPHWVSIYSMHGLRIFPVYSINRQGECTCSMKCSSPGKHPITQNGVKAATSDPNMIINWWGTITEANVGIATGAGLVVIDIDPRHGGSVAKLKELCPDIPQTAIVRTGGKGYHIYFSYDPALVIKNSAGKLAPGIDVRGEGGYVLAPPSIHVSGEHYTWERRADIAPLPATLLRYMIDGPGEPKRIGTSPIPQEIRGDAETKNAQGKPAEAAVLLLPEGKRHDSLVRLVGSLHHFGINDEIIAELLRAVNSAHCKPPLPEYEIAQLLKGSRTWKNEQEMHDVQQLPEIYHADELAGMELPEMRWLVEGLLPQGVTILAGRPKAGKSWLMLALGQAVAQGTQALGKLKTEQAEVLYVALEDTQATMKERFTHFFGTQAPPHGLTLCHDWPNLGEGGISALAYLLEANPHIGLIIVDTLGVVRQNKTASSGSAFQDDYATMRYFKELADRYRISIVVVHHVRKQSAQDVFDTISGTLGLNGAADTLLILQDGEEQGQAILHAKGRRCKQQALPLKFNDGNGHWNCHDPETSLPRTQREILELLRENSAMNPHELMEALGKSRAQIMRLLTLLSDARLIRNKGYGEYEVVSDTERYTEDAMP